MSTPTPNTPKRQLGFVPLLLTIFKTQLVTLVKSRKTVILTVAAFLPVAAAVAYTIYENTIDESLEEKLCKAYNTKEAKTVKTVETVAQGTDSDDVPRLYGGGQLQLVSLPGDGPLRQGVAKYTAYSPGPYLVVVDDGIPVQILPSGGGAPTDGAIPKVSKGALKCPVGDVPGGLEHPLEAGVSYNIAFGPTQANDFKLIVAHISRANGLTFYKSILEHVIIAFLLPLFALFYGGPAVIEEVEGRTIIYLFLRPIAKPAIFIGKTAAAVVMTVALTLIPVVLLYLIALTVENSPADHLQLLAKGLVSLLVGGVSYTVIFAALGAVFARSLLAGIVFWGVVEWFGSFIPMLKFLTQNYHIRNAGTLVDLEKLTTLEGWVQSKVIVVDISVSYTFMLATAAVALAVGAWVFNTREYPT